MELTTETYHCLCGDTAAEVIGALFARRLPQANAVLQCSHCRSLRLQYRLRESELFPFYERYAQGTPGFLDRWYSHFKHRHFATRVARGARGGERVLDIGFGRGQLMHILQSQGLATHGIEISEKKIKSAAAAGFSVSLWSGNEALPGASDSYDHITLFNVLEHSYHPQLLLRECHRLLKPGGRAWIVLPNPQSLGAERFGGCWYGLGLEHIFLPDPAYFQQWVEAVGFRTLQAFPNSRLVHWNYLYRSLGHRSPASRWGFRPGRALIALFLQTYGEWCGRPETRLYCLTK